MRTAVARDDAEPDPDLEDLIRMRMGELGETLEKVNEAVAKAQGGGPAIELIHLALRMDDIQLAMQKLGEGARQMTFMRTMEEAEGLRQKVTAVPQSRQRKRRARRPGQPPLVVAVPHQT